MTDLHQVINLHSPLDACLAHAGAIDARIRLHLNVVLDDHMRGLWNLVPMPLSRTRKSESIAADHDSVL